MAEDAEDEDEEGARSRSSERVPWGVNWDCSAGWASVEAASSRTGNGVRFRTWIAQMCRTRCYICVQN